MTEQTLAIIKPDAVRKKIIGKVITKIEENGFTIKALKKVRLKEEDARAFYRVHKGKSFYEKLVKFMISGPIVVLILKGENAIQNWRDIMGDTDPEKAAKGTIRNRFGTTVRKNAVHGSDSQQSAVREINFFFNYMERI